MSWTIPRAADNANSNGQYANCSRWAAPTHDPEHNRTYQPCHCYRTMLDPSQAPENQDMRSHLDQSNIMYYVISCIAEQCRTEQEK